ncbi:non-specific lipid-transfer protein 2-like [Phalaenopsis equestris]|uniref:non-specific lipid-transfer protein 2-like n=1 Tax=Phalaenopsis equestris TaxID=78828 RepID=UPI0009E22F87|nr:non-specific lipid-transfer protein 2-like [Phalaenopsis equestris]
MAALTCNPMELSPCMSAILSSAPPSASCCSKLKEQQPCFCQYEKNPQLKGYMNSSNSNKVANFCEVPIPKC